MQFKLNVATPVLNQTDLKRKDNLIKDTPVVCTQISTCLQP